MMEIRKNWLKKEDMNDREEKQGQICDGRTVSLN